MIRLFAALALPPEIAEPLRALCSGLPGARWVNPEQFHITLRFIGEVDGRTARSAAEALAGITMPAFDLTLRGLGTFGDKRKAHSLWAGVAPTPGLERLHDKVEGALARIGLAPERRKFTPHVTLARLSGVPLDRLGAYLAHHGLFSSPTFTCDRFTLFSSFLSHSGAIYTPERIIRLDGSEDWMEREAAMWGEDDEDLDHAYGADPDSWRDRRGAVVPLQPPPRKISAA